MPDDRLHRLDLGGAADPAHRVADVDRRAHAGVEEVGLEETWPSVIEMTLVGMYAEMSPALVSMIGSAVSDPPPSASDSLAQRSSSRLCR